MTPTEKAPAASPTAKAVSRVVRAGRAALTGRTTTPKPAAKAPAKKAPAAKKAVPAKAPAKKAPAAKKAVPAKAPAKKAPAAKKAVPAKAPAKKAPAAPPVKAAPVKEVEKPVEKKVPTKPKTGPYASDAKFLEEQRVLLEEERAVYLEQATSLKAEADSLALDREPGDVQFDEESGEGGTVTVDRERDLAMSAQASAIVEEIDDALARIKTKFYGSCERCHQPIPKLRLRALPYARLCVACKSGGLSSRR